MNLRDRIESGLACRAAVNGKFARPGAKPSYAPDQEFDAEHILLELDLDVPARSVLGKCTTTLRAIHDGARALPFDAVGFKLLAVTDPSGRRLRHSYKEDKITVTLPKPAREGDSVAVVIQYRLSDPVAGVYFVAPDRHYPEKPVQVWTHGEAEESRYWFPCFDAPHDKAATEVVATVPQDFFALSNGALVDVRHDRARRRKSYHWKQAIPHSPYLVTLVAGRFSEIREEWEGIPVLYYCQPGRETEARRAFGKTPKMLQFFSDAIGVRYPYEKYAQIAVADFVMGGMEHTTATTQTDRVLMDARAYPEFTADWLVSHELAHQWFGDLLTCKEWSHAWLNESFATYFEALFTEHDLGRDEFRYEMRDKLHLYLDEDKNAYRRAIVTNVYRKPDDLFDRHLYEKGALVLHSLRHLLGDGLFWKSIRHYTETHRGRAVETADLINSVQQATGKNLRRFFDQYVYGPGHPDYAVDYWWEEKRKTAHLRVRQKPGGGQDYFSLPVTIEFQAAGAAKRFTEQIAEKEHEFKYRFAREPLDVRFDPDHGILKTCALSKPYAMWKFQLARDPHVAGRAQAAHEIAKLGSEESLRALKGAFLKERFWGAAREIALAIGSLQTGAARDFLSAAAASTRHPKARRAVVEALGRFPTREAWSKLEERFRRDKSYFVGAEAARQILQARAPQAARVAREALRRDSWNETVRAAAVACLWRSPGPQSARLLRSFAAYGRHPSLRGAAVQSLSKLARSYPALFEQLIGLTQDRQVRVRMAAISALGNLRDPRAKDALKKVSKDKALPYRLQAAAEDALLKIFPKD